jgi:hypothetical protein
MFEHRGRVEAAGGAVAPHPPLAASSMRAWAAGLGAEDGSAMSDAERIELIGALEGLANAARACQAVVTAEFDRSQRVRQARTGASSTWAWPGW